MQALAFWKSVAQDKSNFLEAIVSFLEQHHIRFCVIGGAAVNAYVEPLVTLDLDLVVAADRLPEIDKLASRQFAVTVFPYSINLSQPDSKLRVQIQTDPRYFPFVDRSSTRDVLDIKLPVAVVEDVLQGKIWAANDLHRRGSKRQKDLADIYRLIEAFPHLRARVPADILERLV